MKRSLALALLWLLSGPSGAQDINFDDLRKPGPGLKANAVVGGVARESAELMARFPEVDRSRLGARPGQESAGPQAGNARRNAAPAAVAAAGPSRFVCAYRCTDNRFIVINEGKSGPLVLQVQANDAGLAREMAAGQVKNACWEQFKLAPKGDWLRCRAQ